MPTPVSLKEREERKQKRGERRVRKNAPCAALYHNQHEHQAGTLWLKFPQNKEKRPCCYDIFHHRAQIKSVVYVNLGLMSEEMAVEIEQGVYAGCIGK